MLNLLRQLLHRSGTGSVRRPASYGQVAVMERSDEIEIMSSGTSKAKIAEPVSWPTRRECRAAQGSSEPVMFTVIFPDRDYETDIPVYVDNCRAPSDGSTLLVDGRTGLGLSGLDISVIYDYPSMSWAQNIDPDQPRLIMYKD